MNQYWPADAQILVEVETIKRRKASHGRRRGESC